LIVPHLTNYSTGKAADGESLAWLKASEPAFAFWDNEEDAVWDLVEPQPSD
jgi:hypothetical protein